MQYVISDIHGMYDKYAAMLDTVGFGDDDVYTHCNNVCIDCGAVFGGKLACLRLDDMAEFYV